MSGDYSAGNAVIVAVLVGLPVVVVGLFGLTWWERYQERRTARGESRRQHVREACAMNRRALRRPWCWMVAVVAATGMILGPANVASASVSTVPDSTAAVTGTIYAMARIGNRTIIGGDFTAVGGVARRNAAAIRADGTVDPSFAPNPNGTVLAIAVSAQPTRVFLGGTFTKVGGVPRARL